MTRAAVSAAIVGAVLAGAACKGGAHVAQSGVTSGGSGGAAATITTASSSSHASSSSGSGGQACVDAAAAIGKATSIAGGACTSVVRLDYASLKITAFQLVCGPYGAGTESDARAKAQKDTGFGQTGASLAGATPADDWVFWQSASDFGGSAVVRRAPGSARSGAPRCGRARETSRTPRRGGRPRTSGSAAGRAASPCRPRAASISAPGSR